MKTCPVCNVLAFDDAKICFGCMHRFEGDENVVAHGEEEPQPVASTQQASGFYVKLTPTTNSSGAVTWACAVEPAS